MSKKNNALKREQYGTPLPLPCLQAQPQLQKQQQKLQCQSNGKLSTCSSWSSPLSVIQEIFRLFTWAEPRIHTTLNLIEGDFHPGGESVWVTHHQDMSRLFRQGFFGKGTLSRSEATWRQRNTTDSQDISLEELTRQRRVERAQLRKDKKLKAQQGDVTVTITATPPQQQPPSAPLSARATPSLDIDAHGVDDENFEHLQLALEEAFFLVFAVECLAISTPDTAAIEIEGTASHASKRARAMSIQECWLRFAEASVLVPNKEISPSTSQDLVLTPGNRFFVRYVAYHYYRSQGWIVKDGLKYGTDFLLYKKGLVFGHSQYAVRIVPCRSTELETGGAAVQDARESFGNGAATTTAAAAAAAIRPSSFMSPSPGMCVPHAVYSWQWLLTLNRVIAQVQKTVILCHVILPLNATREQLSHPRTALTLYNVVEIGIKRFIPERNRA